MRKTKPIIISQPQPQEYTMKKLLLTLSLLASAHAFGSATSADNDQKSIAAQKAQAASATASAATAASTATAAASVQANGPWNDVAQLDTILIQWQQYGMARDAQQPGFRPTSSHDLLNICTAYQQLIGPKTFEWASALEARFVSQEYQQKRPTQDEYSIRHQLWSLKEHNPQNQAFNCFVDMCPICGLRTPKKAE
jgi:hypothetical protein